jgi:hypothetical protein
MPGLRRRSRRTSRVPLVVGAVILTTLVVSATWVLMRPVEIDEPWRIDYPGLTVLPGGEDYLSEGKRFLMLIVRFDKPVVSADDARHYIAALVRETRTVYHYYLVKVLNANDVHVLDVVADRHERHSIFATERYTLQSAALAPAPSEAPEALIDETPGDPAARKPWEFDHPGVHWLSGRATTDEAGRRRLRVTVLMEDAGTTAEDVDRFIRALAERQAGHYDAFRVKVFNRRGTQRWEATLDASSDGGTVVIPW